MRQQPNLEIVLAALKELSDRREQERLWLSTGAAGSEVSSPTEAVCALFDDSGLGQAIDWSWLQRQGGRPVLDAPLYHQRVDGQIVALREMLRGLPSGPPQQVIDSWQMGAVRDAASALLSDLEVLAVQPPRD